jgi:hypothetical protein
MSSNAHASMAFAAAFLAALIILLYKKAHRETAFAFPDAPLHLIEYYYIAMP